MSATHEHPSYAGRLGAPPAQLAQVAPIIDSIPDVGLTALARADRSCCCTAKPAVIAFMPSASSRRGEPGLLLCMHHYRASRQRLMACGARIVDGTGALLTDRDLW
jgi:hypothetical protein